ncbi:MAG: glycosyltransferase [Thalassospira sp.]|uniref:glycosyltransferase n=1 Tax=Thalassospira sp. TaxID=1912094 RepID=UPI0032EAE301
MGRHPTNAKVLVVIGSLDKGGCETHLLQVMPGLVQRGYDVSIFLLARPGVLGSQMEEAGIRLIKPWVQIAPRKRYSRIFRVFRLFVVSLQFFVCCLIKRPRIVHFFLPASYWLAGPISILAGIKCRIMSRRSLNIYLREGWVAGFVEKILHRYMHAVLGNSKAIVAQLLQDEGVSVEKVGLIYNGVAQDRTPDFVRHAYRSRLGISKKVLTLTTIANLIPYKGHVDLLEALSSLPEKNSCSWKLLLAGRDDGFGKTLKERARILGVECNVIFMGSVKDVHALLAATDIFVLPSHQEGFSNALLEAMAAGKAIVATDVGGNAEAIVDGDCGLIVPPCSPEAMLTAISALMSNQQERERLGVAARRRAEQNFGIEKCLTDYECLYRCLLAGEMVSAAEPMKLVRELVQSQKMVS